VGESLLVAVAQPPSVPYDVAANAERHAETVLSAGARVVVFPELSLTGYELDAPAITATDPRLTPIIEACSATGSVALVGAPVEKEAGRPYIAMLAIDSFGAAVAYQKMWLSETESRRFMPGPNPSVLDIDGWRLGLAICKDTGVPEHASATAALSIDAYVASVLHSAKEASLYEEHARRVATEHHVWVVVASFAGSAGGGYVRAAGRSAIWGRDGVVVAHAGPEAGAMARTKLKGTRRGSAPPKCEAGSRMETRGLTVRHPVPMDHLRLVEAWSAWSDQPLRREASGLLQRLFVTHFANTSFVAESRDGSLAGCLIGFLSQSHPDEAYVHFVAVRPDYRRRGLATFLYERFFDCCRRHGRRVVRGVTSPANKGSIDFHRRLGFALEAGGYERDGIPIHRDYDGPGIDMVLLRKDLTEDG
jgi:predicted amidohydrolase/GNAT superfamily N-acetyltransferase